MNIAVIGTGYVGLVTGVCFSDLGNRVYCVDHDKEKIEKLKQGVVPIFEPGLEALIKTNQEEKRLSFITDIQEALLEAEVCFIAVGTPMGSDGSADITEVLRVAQEIATHADHDMIVVDKSTVPPGTGEKVHTEISKILTERGVCYSVNVASNPEFLKEGSAVTDFMSPDRVIIGAQEDKTAEVLKELYAPLTRNRECIFTMDVKSAEMTKYASNAMLATRISFMNEIANLCEAVGADINHVRLGMGSDRRIGYSFLYAGCGYGGSCFPKDVRALIRLAEKNDRTVRILEQVELVNRDQKQVIISKVMRRFGQDLTGYSFAVWGLSFKPNTDDIREAPSLVIIPKLLELGAKVRVYDPKAMESMQQNGFPETENFQYCSNKYLALENTDALILLTEWKEFRSPDFDHMKEIMKNPIIFDGRNQYKPASLKRRGIEYLPIGLIT